MRPARLTLALALTSTLVGCASTGPSRGSGEGDLLATLTAAYNDLAAEAAPLQTAFRERVEVGMSMDDVRTTAATIASEAGHSPEQTYRSGSMAVRREGGGAACFAGGAPTAESTRTEGSAHVQSWEYACVDTVFVLEFRDGRLASLTERPAD